MGKRRRTNKGKPLTQEEIWDDSALVQSWEDAVEEYKLYHSIQAKGENVEEVLREIEEKETEAAAEEDDIPEEPRVERRSAEARGEQADGATEQNEELEPRDEQPGKQPGRQTPRVPSEAFNADASTSGGFSGMPQMVMGGTNAPGQDETLKNLMMSWYFSGYYTGLYEGQQRANQQS